MGFPVLPLIDNSEEEVGTILRVGVEEERGVSKVTARSPLT